MYLSSAVGIYGGRGGAMADPIYRRIAEDLRSKIESGELEPGSQLPTELELREQYDNASRNTIRDAIRWLTTRGLVVTQPGRGTFVVEKITPFVVPLNPSEPGAGADSGKAFQDVVVSQGGKPIVGDPRVEVQNAREEVARELQMNRGDSVVIRHQQRFIDGRPSSLQTSYYPMQFVIDGAVELLQATDIKQGGTKYVEQELGIRQVGYRDRLTVRPPNVGEVRFFKVPDDGSVLMVVVHRTAYSEGNKPIRFTASVYPADRNHFVIDFGKVPDPQDLIEDIRKSGS
jgi:GntR family transcriptional regulator